MCGFRSCQFLTRVCSHANAAAAGAAAASLVIAVLYLSSGHFETNTVGSFPSDDFSVYLAEDGTSITVSDDRVREEWSMSTSAVELCAFLVPPAVYRYLIHDPTPVFIGTFWTGVLWQQFAQVLIFKPSWMGLAHE